MSDIRKISIKNIDLDVEKDKLAKLKAEDKPAVLIEEKEEYPQEVLELIEAENEHRRFEEEYTKTQIVCQEARIAEYEKAPKETISIEPIIKPITR